ncbi:MAG: sigma-70 family RNA polymerase sigma factor [Propionibacteriaceae bacterium]|jgi:RNA polymerase sigma factor (sigma-70 family)|nr:sigma-70 family RNA polymerase sigma factor [Propionibacteriaceae bacterium]
MERLSAEQERDICRQIEVGVLAQAALHGEIERPECSRAELKELAGIGKKAWKTFLDAQRPLIIYALGSTPEHHKLDRAEFIQEGYRAVAEIALRFDYKRGRFSTFALPQLVGVFSRLAASRLGTINLPASTAKARWGVLARGEEQHSLYHYSAPKPLSELEAETLRAPGTEAQMEHRTRSIEVERALLTLPQEERQVVTLRYGLGGRSPVSRQEVSRMLQASPNAVRRLETRALARLRERLA